MSLVVSIPKSVLSKSFSSGSDCLGPALQSGLGVPSLEQLPISPFWYIPLPSTSDMGLARNSANLACGSGGCSDGQIHPVGEVFFSPE